MSRKVLLMGRSGSGKTSMRSVIFQNQVASGTRRLGATIGTETSDVTFLADMKLDLWDCGGQESFMDNYINSQRDHIFRGVHTLIYIFDVESTQFLTTDMHYFVDCLNALKSNSGLNTEAKPGNGSEGRKGAFVHVLIHKMDLVPLETREATFEAKSREIKRKCAAEGYQQVVTFGTSIWDETLYKAWSHIVSTFIPNVDALRQHLRRFADVCNAAEVILFEERTFLLISQATATGKEAVGVWEPGRFERISQVIKVFRLNCTRLLGEKFASLQVANPSYTAVLDKLTDNTYIMVISSDPGVQPAGILHNIRQSKAHFSKLQAATWGATL